jgi:adenine-specific DNA-methyltransferase
MKVRTEVTAEKLRGGFYTPAPLIETCLDRVSERLPHGDLSVLEPSAGDGAFLHALGNPEWQRRVKRVVAIEPLEIEAEKSRQKLAAVGLAGEVIAASALPWATESNERFDVALGNPPFVRYQFISADDRAATLTLGKRLGVEFSGVSNLWIPVLLSALGRLRAGGVFSFVIPTECLTGCSASAVRQWLIEECEEVCFDLFNPGSFPAVLQEVMILSGCRAGADKRSALPIRIVEHLPSGARDWSYEVKEASAPWTRYLLDPVHLEALEEALALPLARPLGDLVAFEVSIVTGANDFFSVDDATLREYDLARWRRPLLARTRHAPGLVFTETDREYTRAKGEKAWLLDFSADRPDPLTFAPATRYLRQGEEAELHERYKCRIRDPWYRVPGIVRGELMLSKRSHLWPRVVVNEAEVYTTDTIYRGRMLTAERTPGDVAAAFHNSVTLLTAELEGRSFGGGVLELVPSEIARLTTVIPGGFAENLPELDRLARSGKAEAVVEATDAYLVSSRAVPAELVPLLREARELLASRRFGRNRRGVEVDARQLRVAA